MRTPPDLSAQRTARRAQEKAAFGDALAAAMRARGMSQAELAEALDVTQSMVSVWRNGQYECPHDIVFDMERVLSLAPGTLSIRAGYLPPEAVQGATPSVYDSVLADELLLDANKHTLLTLYEHFVNTQTPAKKAEPRRGSRTAKGSPRTNGRTKARSRPAS